jgi:hypothetical protein
MNQTSSSPNTTLPLMSWMQGTQTLSILVYTVITIGFLCSVLLAFVPIYNGDGEATHWIVPLSIATLVVFMPLTAISFLHYRLPKKQKEFQKIIETLSSSEHGAELESFVVDSEHKHSDYFLPVLFVSLFSAIGFYILISGNAQVLFKAMVWVDAVSTEGEVAYRTSLVACGFSFLGAYVWSIQYVFRRMVTLDLPPGAYYSVATRLVFSSFLILIYSHFTYANSEYLSSSLPLIAFLTGIFPERLLTWLKESSGSIFSSKAKMAHDLPLEMIEGIDSFHKARLSELGIDNVQNLAHASLVELIIKTPFTPRILVDWMAQAKLCQEFKEKVNDIRDGGVRTILDFQEIAEADLLASLAARSNMELSLLEAVYCANKDEKSIARLRDAYDRLSLI